MNNIKFVLKNLFWLGLASITGFAFFNVLNGKYGWIEIFNLGFYVAPITTLIGISLYGDLLNAVQQGKQISIKARLFDLVHWVLLIFVSVGTWLAGGVTIWWIFLEFVLIGMIGWVMGVGIGRQWLPTKNEKIFGAIFLSVSMAIGLTNGYIRTIDQSFLGFGWLIDIITAVLATLIFIWSNINDIFKIKANAKDYPRPFFIKEISANALVIWFWMFVIYHQGTVILPVENSTVGAWLWHIFFNGNSIPPWYANFGLTFNVLVGNLTSLIFYIVYEYYKRKQGKRQNF